MRITRHKLRMLIEHALVEQATGERMHRCFGGALVPFGSPECVDDISARIEDARDIRDQCDNRTDKRDYYNGVLKVLRREMRDAQKVGGVPMTAEAEDLLMDEER